MPYPVGADPTTVRYFLGSAGITTIPEYGKNVKGTDGINGSYTPFIINQQGVSRTVYNGQPKGFTYLDNTTGNISFKLSDTSGDWSADFPWTGADSVFSADFDVELTGGKTLGKYVNGQTVPATGKTAKELLLDIAVEYTPPSFTSFAITAQATQIEVGTTIASGAKTFTWNTLFPSKINVSSIVVRDVTASVDRATGLANDGTESVSIPSAISLLTPGANQIFRILGVNTLLASFQRDFTIVANYLRRWGTPASTPVNSADVRALANSLFGSSFNMLIVQGQTTICFAYEASRPDITDASVKYIEGFNANVGNTFTKTTFNVNDAAGTPVSFKLYTSVVGAPFPTDVNYSVVIP